MSLIIGGARIGRLQRNRWAATLYKGSGLHHGCGSLRHYPARLLVAPRDARPCCSASPTLTSLGVPSPHMFVPASDATPAVSSLDTVDLPQVVVHTAYASDLLHCATASDGGHRVSDGEDARGLVSPASAAKSFVVTDAAAFENLIEEALRVTTTSSIASMQQQNADAKLLVNHTVRELQTLLVQTEKTLAPLAAHKAKIDRYAYGIYYPLLKYGSFALLAAQFAVYFNWIFFVFDWNLVEPTTYFIAYTGVLCSLVYHYYRCGEAEFTWRNLFHHLASRKAAKAYAKDGLDPNLIAQLQGRVALLKEELARYESSFEALTGEPLSPSPAR